MFWRIWPVCILVTALSAADLPITEVTLYKHGVAHLERSGELKPGETARLDFKPDDMNDVLKSLTVTDRNGGKVNGVRYDSSDPLEKRLADFPFQLGAGASLAAFLDQMKGARIELKLGPGDATGVIISAREVEQSDKDRPSQHEVLVLLMDSGDIRSFDLGAASAVKLSDPKQQSQLAAYLTVLNQSHARDRRSVYIDAVSSGARQLIASYMTPAPVWKSSYRLMFGAAGEPTLEGWAIIDNTSGDDWNNVRLAVVSGKPVSFITRLYEPRYVQRPFAELAENQAAAPIVYQGAMEAAKDQRAAAPKVQVQAQAGALPLNGRNFAMLDAIAPSSFAATADTRQAGELFEYSFAAPVTVKQGESAMLPFLQQKIGARKLLVYCRKLRPKPARCRRAHQQHRQNARRRPHHRIRRRNLRRRSVSRNPAHGRQATHQLRGRPGNSRHHRLRFFASRSPRNPFPTRHPYHPQRPAGNQNLHHQECRRESQDPRHSNTPSVPATP